MSKHEQKAAVLEREEKRPPVTAIDESWPLGEAGAKQKKKTGRESPLNRFSQALHNTLIKGLSNLRLSLTLRIALHYAGQLLKTTIPMLVVTLGVLGATQYPKASRALDELAKMKPADGRNYTVEQLGNLPFERAYLLEQPLDGGLPGLGERLGLLFSQLNLNGESCLMLYTETPMGGLMGAYRITDLMFMGTVLFWTLICADLYRVGYFLRHRNRLNKKVLKPITDMAETAATLSANNLSDRISVEGAKNELKDLALVINGMLDRIEVSYNSQKQFVSDASHELRTPIAVIQGYVGMLERWGKTDKEVLDEGIAAISQEAASMKELVERLLFLARHDKKTLLLEMEVFDPLEVMSEVHREAKLLSSAHRFELNPAQNARINGDKDMLKQLMRILLDNAIKYTPDGGSITLGVRRDSRHCILTVSDTGAGISAEELPKIFDRFYRCDEARKAQTSGHGLGLSIARIIVVAHGGKLKVRSKVGVGTTFSVILPLAGEER